MIILHRCNSHLYYFLIKNKKRKHFLRETVRLPFLLLILEMLVSYFSFLPSLFNIFGSFLRTIVQRVLTLQICILVPGQWRKPYRSQLVRQKTSFFKRGLAMVAPYVFQERFALKNICYSIMCL